MTQPWTPPYGLEQQPQQPQQPRDPRPYGPPPPRHLRAPQRPGGPPHGIPPQRGNGSHPHPHLQPRPPQPPRPGGQGRHRAYEPPVGRAPEPPQSPPQAQPPQPADRPAESRNGLGLAAAILGPVGILFGLVPLTGFVAVVCGLVGVPLALAGRSRYRKRLATNGRTALFGLVSGVLALALGVWGLVVVVQATNTLVDALDGPAPVSAGAPGQAQPGSTAVAAFGERVTFDDGVAVEVSAPEAFEPGSFAVGDTRERAVRFEVTIVNGGDEPLDAVAAVVRATHDGREAPQIVDPDQDVGLPAQGRVLPGKSITFPVAVSIGQGTADLQVDVTPRFVGDPAIFTGRV